MGRARGHGNAIGAEVTLTRLSRWRRVDLHPSVQGGDVHARVATFQGDPANVDMAVEQVRAEVESGTVPAAPEGAKMLMLVDRSTGKGLGITLFDSEDAMRRGDEALNAMNPGAGERRLSVEFYEVPVHSLG